MRRPMNPWLWAFLLLVSASTVAFAQTEDDVVINEIVAEPTSGKEYVELLVVTGGLNLQGWTVSDVNSRTGGTSFFSGDIRLPLSGSYLASLPAGVYIVIELSTPGGNSSVLSEDLSLSDATPTTLIIKPSTAGVTTNGTLNFESSNDNVQLYAGTRATGQLIDQVLWGSNTAYISGASWGDNNGSTTSDNINNGNNFSVGNYALSFVPADQSSAAGFRANDAKGVWPISQNSYGTPGSVNFGVNDSPLPVQLRSFTGRWVSGSSVRLDWITQSEVNNYGFSVQRHLEGESEFNALPNNFIPGHGTTLEPRHYSFTDETTTPGTWLYRLEQIDLDGTLHYSEPIAVGVDAVTSVGDHGISAAFALEQNYPNPFNPTTVIQYSLPKAAHVTLNLFTLLGGKVMTLVDEQQQAGVKQVTLNGSNLPSGVYLYQLDVGDFLSTKRLVLLK